MAAQKFLSIINGVRTLLQAVVTSAGAGDDGKIPALDATGKLDISMMPTGLGADTVAATASEALNAGDFVNLYNASGVLKARKADASVQTKRAHGFVKAAVSNNGAATVYKEGTNDQLSGLTLGDELFLSDSTPGGVTNTAPTGNGKLLQLLGVALSATSADFDPNDWIKLNS